MTASIVAASIAAEELTPLPSGTSDSIRMAAPCGSARRARARARGTRRRHTPPSGAPGPPANQARTSSYGRCAIGDQTQRHVAATLDAAGPIEMIEMPPLGARDGARRVWPRESATAGRARPSNRRCRPSRPAAPARARQRPSAARRSRRSAASTCAHRAATSAANRARSGTSSGTADTGCSGRVIAISPRRFSARRRCGSTSAFSAALA